MSASCSRLQELSNDILYDGVAQPCQVGAYAHYTLQPSTVMSYTTLVYLVVDLIESIRASLMHLVVVLESWFWHCFDTPLFVEHDGAV